MWISLSAGGIRWAVAAVGVRQVVRARRITRVPLACEGVIGVMVERGRAVPVYRLEGRMMAPLPGGSTGPTGRLEDGAGPPAGPAKHGEEWVAILEHEGIVAGFLINATQTHAGEPPAGVVRVDARGILARVGAFGREGNEGAAGAAEGE